MQEGIGYTRISRQEAGVDSIGLEVQRETIDAYCKMRRISLVEVFEDANVSGGKPLASRTSGAKLVGVLRDKPRVLIASRQDRLFRSIADAVATMKEFREIGVDVVCIAEGLDLSTPAGRLLFHIMAATGEYERELIGIRTQDAMDLKRSRREQISRHATYGFVFRPTNRTNKHGRTILELVPDQAEQQVIKQMLLRHAGGYSYRRIGAWLDSQGVKTRQGGKWAPSSVRKIIAEAKLRGVEAGTDALEVTSRHLQETPGDSAQGGTAP